MLSMGPMDGAGLLSVEGLQVTLGSATIGSR